MEEPGVWEEQCLWRSDCEINHGLSTAQGATPSPPTMLKGQLNLITWGLFHPKWLLLQPDSHGSCPSRPTGVWRERSGVTEDLVRGSPSYTGAGGPLFLQVLSPVLSFLSSLEGDKENESIRQAQIPSQDHEEVKSAV